ncbi:deleted in malignant brain tumors 1 protein-like [Ostrea edulis]|uniref:deleted in malignant brain tumors 1 protein-like n=1 Tax=Ostrea edulis TaxID=37623 RepID=UPI0024AF9BE0|nr:deleted in malignant brain tumors 1 protein-like [Ostrea edulis]
MTVPRHHPKNPRLSLLTAELLVKEQTLAKGVLAILQCTCLSNAASTSIRLVNGMRAHEGRVEVYHGAWGTVCDDYFGSKDAAVVCRMLGYRNVYAKAYGRAHFGQGNGNILMDNVQCGGNESDISACTFRGWGTHDCRATEDAGVSCDPLPYFRLHGGNNSDEGFLSVLKNGTWYPMCDETISDAQINMSCQMMGYRYGGYNLGNFSSRTVGSYYKITNMQCLKDMICYSDPFPSTRCDHGHQVFMGCYSSNKIRLVGGSKASEGRIEVKHKGIWGSICSSNFSVTEGKVICRSLGYDGSHVTVYHGGMFGHGEGPEVISDLTCRGVEEDIAACSKLNYTERPCPRGNEVGVTCGTTPLRLVGGAGPWEGRLEIQNGGQWKGVCKDSFNQRITKIICKMMGFPDSDVVAEIKPDNFYGRGPSGHMISITNCREGISDIGGCVLSRSCFFPTDVGIRCHTKDIRLQGGSHPMEGRVEVKVQGQWSTVCDDNWDNRDATTVCRMLTDYPIDRNVTGTAFQGAFFGTGTGRVAMSNVQCNGSEVSLFTCPADMTGGVNCDHSRDAGVSCSVNNSVVLVGTSSSSTTGTVSIVEGGHWNSVCDHSWTREDARVVCRSLGYWSTSPSVYVDAWFGQSNGTSLDIEPDCTGSEHDLAFCRLNKEWGNQSCSHSDDVGVECTPTAIGFHNVRLSDGKTAGRGRLEVFYNGQWGSFCLDNWSQNNTDVVCKMMHFRSGGFSSYNAPQGTAPVLVSSLGCFGNESDIGYCTANFQKENCQQTSVGVDCTGGLKVRFVDSAQNFSGRVQVYKDGSWGELCSSALSDNEANVLCSMAGFKNSHAHIIPGPAHLTGKHGVVKVIDLQCDGWEEHIQQCSYSSSGGCSNVGAHAQCFACTDSYTTARGNLSSTGYPQDYPKSDCVYTITPPNTTAEIYKLTIKDLDINSTGDTLQITEGPGDHTLALFSGSHTDPPVVAGKEFVVRFTSDMGSQGHRGFTLDWSPLTLEDAITVLCDTTSWRIVVNMTLLRMLYPDSGVSQIYLSKQSCTGHVVDDTIVFDQSYSNCSTSKTISDQFVSYENQLVYPESKTPFPIIVHGYRWRVDVKCDLDRYEHVTQHYKPTEVPLSQTTFHHQVGGSGHYDTKLQFYTDPQYFHEINGNPIIANIGENIYVKVSLNNNDYGTKMRLDTCEAMPEAISTSQSTYVIIKNGCSVDPSTQIVSQGTHETRFLFNAFVFPSNQNAVYISCNATFCPTTDFSSKCAQTCRHGRSKIIDQSYILV